MRFTLLIIFSTVSIAASAQFWQKSPPPKPPVRYAPLPLATDTKEITPVTAPVFVRVVCMVPLKRSIYEIEMLEEKILAEAKHNMRFRIYNLASYNFSELAELYLLQDRFSEAKWYLLQSNNISKVQNDDKHTIANLLGLAAIKMTIGELVLAKADLTEAHDLANNKHMLADLTEIEKRQHDLELYKPGTEKPEFRYSEAVEAAAAAKVQ